MRGSVVMVLIAGVLVAGCGDSDDDGRNALPDEDTPAVPKATNVVSVTETEFKIDPAELEAGEGLVTIKVANDGKVGHSLAIDGPNGRVEIDGEVEPGSDGTLEADLDKPGTYNMYCPIGDHAAEGMRGTITVSGSSPARGAEPAGTTTQTQTTPTQTQTQTQTQTTTQTQTVTTPTQTDSGPTATTGSPSDGY